ncbi:MAG: ATP-binding protein [Desulfobaccales bacterium]
MLRLVFDNLVANACQAMPEGGVVRIVVGEGRLNDERCIKIEVIDEGHGMDESVLSRAVDPLTPPPNPHPNPLQGVGRGV